MLSRSRHHQRLRRQLLLLGLSWAPQVPAQHLHHLAATPQTVAYGYSSAVATRVLRGASGDTVSVATLITNRAHQLQPPRRTPAHVQPSFRDIVSQVAAT